MNKNNAPLLSVGLLFKNEIRCLERCLKSLQPLKEQISCEIVMADTGSDDGSRAVAEKYADIVFDFPWINDIGAARNAVLERCRGEWHLYMNCDEWLDGDVTELVRFLKQEPDPTVARCFIHERDYMTRDLNQYSDIQTGRLLKMSWAPSFAGTIKLLVVIEKPGWHARTLENIILHRDGFVERKNADRKGGKRHRSVQAAREDLQKDPKDLSALCDFLEAGELEPDFVPELSRATGLVTDREKDWDVYGPKIYRSAIRAAREKKLPQLGEWTQQAKELFSQTFCYRIDIQFMLCRHACDGEDYSSCIPMGEDYEQALKDMKNDPRAAEENASGEIHFAGPAQIQDVNAALALAYAETGRNDDAVDRLAGAEWTLLTDWPITKLLYALRRLHASGGANTEPLLLVFWEGINREKPKAKQARERRSCFLKLGSEDPFWETDGGAPLFAPLKGKCVLGDAAEMLETKDAARLGELLARQDKLAALPTRVLVHALAHGAPFWPADRPLTPEAAEDLAAELFAYPGKALALALASAEGDFSASWQSLLWARSLTLRAAHNILDGEAADALSVMRAFAGVEGVFLSRYYTPRALEEPGVLPADDRLGHDLVRVFEALDAEKYSDCVRLMRESLEAAPERMPMAEALLEEVRRREKARRAAAAPPELLEMAEKVRSLLATLPPDDPAVAQLKQSPTYQALAHLIEEPDKKIEKGVDFFRIMPIQ